MRVVRYERALRMHATDSGTGHAERCGQQLHVLHSADHGRAADEYTGSDERAAGVRRPVQVLTSVRVRPGDAAATAWHNQRMSLISPADQDKLPESLAEPRRPVRLLFFTQTVGCETCPITRRILDELLPLSDKITLEEINIVLEPDRARTYGIDRAPGIAIAWTDEAGQQQDSRIRFLGAPAGYEFISLVQAVLLAGGRPSILTDENQERVKAVTRPLSIQVFTTPG